MQEVQQRLMRCFSAVFPQLTHEQMVKASASKGDWDSLTMVTLLALVEEEFGVILGVDDMETLISFDAILTRIQGYPTVKEDESIASFAGPSAP